MLATWKPHWKPDSIRQQLFGRQLPWKDVDFGLWVMRPFGPEPVKGLRVQPYFPVLDHPELASFRYFFHPESGNTLIEHATSIATFDGSRLEAIPSAPKWPDDGKHTPGQFLRLGELVVYVRPEGLWRLRDDLSFEPMAMPEPSRRTTLVSFDYSEALKRIVVSGGHPVTQSELSAAYTTRDFVSYEKIEGSVGRRIVRVLGDTADQHAAVAVSAGRLFLLADCRD